MIILNTTTKKLQILLEGAATTTAPVFTGAWADRTASAFSPGSSDGTTNGSTAVDMIAAPAASTARMVSSLCLFNGDTVSHIVTVQLNDNGSLFKLVSIAVAAGQSLIYEDKAGWAISQPVGTTGTGLYVLQTSPALLGSPTAPTPATSDNSTKLATTAFVQSVAAGINPAVAVSAATTAASDTSGMAYSNGSSGVGATMTGTVNTAVTIDRFTFTAVNQTLLIKNDTQSPSGAYNGRYVLTQLQNALLAPVFTRATDYDTPSDINGTGIIPVINGTVNADTTWVITSSVTTIGTDPLTYTQFSKNPANVVTAAANLSAGQPITGDDGAMGVKTGVKVGLAYGGTNADLSATGGAHNYLKQSSSGAAVTVGQPAIADLSDGSAVARTDTAQTFTGNQTVNAVTGLITVNTGARTPPTASNGTAAFGSSLSGGAVIQGQGSVYDLVFQNTIGLNVVSIATSGNSVRLPNMPTTASSANVFADNTTENALFRSTSSVRYKTNVQYIGETFSGQVIDDLKPIAFTSKAAADDQTIQRLSFLAEDVAAVHPMFATWAATAGIDQTKPPPDGYATWAAYIAANEKNGHVPDALQQSYFIAVLWAEVKSLRARLKAARIP